MRTTPRPDRASEGRPARAPLCIALTGGIGSGKSEALAAFAACGAATLSSDEVVHRIYGEPEVVAAVRERFGDAVLDADGAVDRGALGPRALAQEGGLAFLERLVHGRVGERRARWIAARCAEDPPPPLLVCEVPVLFEAGIQDAFDAVVVVTASDEVRRARVEARGQDFDALRARQVPEREKVARADASYVNDGTVEALRAWVAGRFAEYAGRPCGSPTG